MTDKDSSQPQHDESLLEEVEGATAPDEAEGEAVETTMPEPLDDVAAAHAEIQVLHDQLRRSQAELVNFRRRTNRERLERMDAARADLLRALLPVLDDLDRAVHDGTDNIDAYREGVELILRALHDTLRQLDVVRIDPDGEPFDPHHHEAVEQEQTDAVPAGHVTRVYQPGYLFKERLLRPATVAVAVAESGAGQTPDGED